MTTFMAALLGLVSPFLAVAQPRTTFSVRIARISSGETPSSVKLAYLLGSLASVTVFLTTCGMLRFIPVIIQEGLGVRVLAGEAARIVVAATTTLMAAALTVILQLTLDTVLAMTVLSGELYAAAVARLLSYIPYSILYAVEPPEKNPLAYVAWHVINLADPLGFAVFALSITVFAYSLLARGLHLTIALKALLIMLTGRLVLTLAGLFYTRI